ncbi:hypothetical protein BH18GEM1_BH18GEM1_08600 [soil metagenome]
MRRMNIAFAAILLAVPTHALAQHQATAALAITDPRGELDDNTDTGFGFTGSYLYAFGRSRTVAIGVTGAFQSYGRTGRRAAISSTIPDITVDIETSNNTTFLQGAMQLKAPTGVVQPYLQGTAGYGWFFTTTALEDPLTDRTVLTDTNQSDGTWIWGGGGGLLVRVYEAERGATLSAYERVGGEERDPVRAYVDAGARWLAGEEVEYLKEGTLVTDQGEFDIDPRLARSDIELVQYQIGLTVEF